MVAGGSQGEPLGSIRSSRSVPDLVAASKAGFGKCYLNAKGYLVISGGAFRKRYLHRVIWQHVSGRKLPAGWQVHHMFGKGHFCAESLIALPACLHPTGERLRDPYTGQFLTADQWRRRYATEPTRGG